MDIDSVYIIFVVGLFVLGGFGVLLFLLKGKLDRIQQLSESLKKMKNAFKDLDEQAKLIVKTDLELNKTQEELDKRLNGLDALHSTSRLISTTLDEDEIFHRLDHSLLTELGYEQNLILIRNKENILKSRVHLGYSDDQVDSLLSNLSKDKSLVKALDEGHSFSSVNSPKQRKDAIGHLFQSEHFVLTPILTQNGTIGILYVGNQSNAAAITEGDDEVISILSNQIGQSLENARLFEQAFKSSQSLETKIQDRTRQLESALEEVKKISKTKSEFISAVSHELRTPLTSIKGYAGLLMTGKLGEIPEKVKQRLEKINTHSDNLVKLINDLLDISRIESGRVEMHMEKCHLAPLVENIRDLLAPQMKTRNIHWNTSIPDTLPEILLDKQQIERVFINLVGNSCKFTPEEGTIGVTAKHDNDEINIELSDTGVGIKEEDIAKLFDEFYRVDNEINQNVKGTGLGLPLAKKIVEAHGGKMWVTSTVNEGTTFHFTLPLKTSPDAAKKEIQ